MCEQDDDGDFIHQEYERVIPARRPFGHDLPPTRFVARWRRPVPYLVADWFGLQGATADTAAGRIFLANMHDLVAASAGAEAVEDFVCAEDETGAPAVVVVAYWTSVLDHERWSHNVGNRWSQHGEQAGPDLGFWRETVVCPYDRHESVYSHRSYRSGLARTDGADFGQTADYGYFGAARDRIPASAIDDLQPSGAPASARSDRAHVFVTVPVNTTIIRSGQYWQESEPEQAEDYELHLSRKLNAGLDYLAGDATSGTIFLRRLTNIDTAGNPLRETSVLAAFRGLGDLERWVSGHATHRAIQRHQIAKAKQFGPRRDVATWHETFVLPPHNTFEYINCNPGTGMTRALSSAAETIDRTPADLVSQRCEAVTTTDVTPGVQVESKSELARTALGERDGDSSGTHAIPDEGARGVR